jgi:hypothetical protein
MSRSLSPVAFLSDPGPLVVPAGLGLPDPMDDLARVPAGRIEAVPLTVESQIAERSILTNFGFDPTPQSGGTFSVVEQETLDFAGGISVSDAVLDALNGGAGDYMGATVTIERDGGADLDDLFDIDATGASFTISGNLIQVGGLTFATFTVNGGTLTITFTSTDTVATAALAQEVVGRVTYTNLSDWPPDTVELAMTLDNGTDLTVDAITVNITAVNDAPLLDLDYTTPGNDAVATYVMGDPATPIAYNAYFDDDNIDWDGATLTIEITGATTDDQLSIDETLLFDVTLDGNNILYQGDIVGTWSGGDNGAPLVITFNALACACAIEEVAYGIAYTNSSASPTPGTRDVTFTFVDGDGTANGGEDTAVATVALTITDGPSPPVIDDGGSVSGDEDSVIELTGVVITDDGDPVTGLVTVHLQVAHGTITIRTDVPGGIDASAIIGGVNGGRGITLTGTPDQINATLAASGGLTYLGNADFNGDDALTIRVQDGTPASPLMITSLGALPFGALPTAVAVADIDGDMLDDLVFGFDPGGGDPGVILTLSGGFGGAALPALLPEAFAFGDFDGDGAVDIAFAAYDVSGAGYVGYVSSDTGDVVLVENIPYALDLVAADFNGDGLMDLAVADSDNGRVAILLQTAPGVFAAPDYSATSGVIANGIRTGDFNGDGVTDLIVSFYGAVGTYAPPGSIGVMIGNGDGTFGAVAPVWSGPSNVGAVTVGDFNGDGYDDYAFASVDTSGDPAAVSGVQVALSRGDGTFDDPVGYVTTASGFPARVIAGDLNGDGILDLVVTNYDVPGTFSILLGNGDGSFQAPIDFDTGDLSYVAALGDFDGDGDLDLMIGNYGTADFEAFNNDSLRRGTTVVKAITVDAVNDAPVAADDADTVAEDGTIVLDVTANDTDVDGGDTLEITEIEGQAVTVGVAITLASGAQVTLNADGTLTYNPNGAFASLISTATAIATGALNVAATDSFAYTLATGGTATVTVTVTGVESAGDQLRGDGAGNVITGTSHQDIFMLHDGGDDTVDGGDGIDGFYMGGSLTPGDSINGGAGNDLLGLQGNYVGYTFSASNMVGIEILVLLSGGYTVYSRGSGADRYSYDLTTIDANVLPGQMLSVNAGQLMTGENLRFDGSAETDGSFFFHGGSGDDTLIGGAGDDIFAAWMGQDTLTGGGGNDLFYFRFTEESPASAPDAITDFTVGDRIHLWALGEPGGLGVSFIGDGDFSSVAGQLRVTGSGTSWTVEVDVDGDGDADFAIDVTTTVSDYQWGASDFVI